ncbi:hypothetical protein SAMN02745218_01229 [Desulfofundulus australicus DSM 11792]|uniref:Uncharacterized protein n=1 Tax=Desulfofundulus australicus DSM 11792 TaxID=1121425 RepID=A0A1M4XZR9_9FIRM|nr:hypothetical protein [Desulfofundulus australicus]SHE98991.1 hypothetical protein SAMN02745218_01229 [Desulfofundulus australicus DSM 11792]
MQCKRAEKILQRVISGLEEAAREVSDRLEQGGGSPIETANLAGRLLACRRAMSFVESLLDGEAKCCGGRCYAS